MRCSCCWKNCYSKKRVWFVRNWQGFKHPSKILSKGFFKTTMWMRMRMCIYVSKCVYITWIFQNSKTQLDVCKYSIHMYICTFSYVNINMTYPYQPSTVSTSSIFTNLHQPSIRRALCKFPHIYINLSSLKLNDSSSGSKCFDRKPSVEV